MSEPTKKRIESLREAVMGLLAERPSPPTYCTAGTVRAADGDGLKTVKLDAILCLALEALTRREQTCETCRHRDGLPDEVFWCRVLQQPFAPDFKVNGKAFGCTAHEPKE